MKSFLFRRLVFVTVLWLFLPNAHALRDSFLITPEAAMRLKEFVRTHPEAEKHWQQQAPEARAALDVAPRPMKTVYYEGRLQTDPKRIETEDRLLGDMDRVVVLANAFAATGEATYANALVPYAQAWSKTYIPTGNPIDENKFWSLMTSWFLIQGHLKDQDRQQFQNWLRDMGNKLMSRKVGMSNWRTKQIKLLAIIGVITDTPKFTEEAIRGFDDYVAAALRPDGSSNDFLNSNG